jgi:hypothetical protein
MHRPAGELRKLRYMAAFLPLIFSMNATAETVLSASFTTNSDGFSYSDDGFRGTSQPSFASGSYQSAGGFSGGGLRVLVGGVNNVVVSNGMSGGWSRQFTLAAAATVSVSLRYRLIVDRTYEDDEYGEALVAIDGALVGPGPADYLERFFGVLPAPATNIDSGWKQVTFNVPLAAGTHTLRVGGYNNKKTTSTEITTIRFDDIALALP